MPSLGLSLGVAFPSQILGGGNPAFNPSDYGTVAAWYSDTGSDASVWPDLSGNGNDAAQATISKQPAIVAAAQNGRQVRRFDGVDDAFTSAFTLSQPFTLFLVMRVSMTGNNVPFSSLEGSVYIAGFTDSTGGFTAGATLNVLMDPLRWNTCAFLASGPSSIVTVNGAVTTGNAGSSSITGGSAIGQYTSGGNYFPGDIAELVICSAVSDRAGMEAALMAKWGITP